MTAHPPHERLREAHERLLAAAAELSRTNDRDRVVATIVDAVRDALGFARVEVHVRGHAGRRADDNAAVARPAPAQLVGHAVPLGDLRGIILVDEPDNRAIELDERLRLLRVFADLAGASFSATARLEAARVRAEHDALTGLANRASLMDQLQGALATARRRGSRVALLFCDLDGFKAINDRLGHAAGDAVLRAVAQRLVESVRPQDAVARLGGDEFVVLCEGLGSDAAQAIVRRLDDALRRPVVVGGRGIDVSASIGVAIGDGEAGPSTLLRVADTDMYLRKAIGRGTHATRTAAWA